MKIVEDYPPNFNHIIEVFGDIEEFTPIFCYGDTIFNPFKIKITPDLEAHERVHSYQQMKFATPDAWWIKYLYDKDFRLEQEIEAYGTQYALAMQSGVRGKMLDWVKENIARSLSCGLYGNLLSYGEAESKIRNYAKNI